MSASVAVVGPLHVPLCPEHGIALTDTCRCYRYTNVDLDHVAVLYECNQEVAYQSFGGCTAFHGSWQRVSDANVLLKFDCRGRVDQLKSATLFHMGGGRFEGFDYKGRTIMLEELRTLRYCTRCEAWLA